MALGRVRETVRQKNEDMAADTTRVSEAWTRRCRPPSKLRIRAFVSRVTGICGDARRTTRRALPAHMPALRSRLQQRHSPAGSSSLFDRTIDRFAAVNARDENDAIP
jgi:hypothetical protein